MAERWVTVGGGLTPGRDDRDDKKGRSMTSGQQIPPAWYPDPERPGGVRYWDGASWTEHRAAPRATQPPKNTRRRNRIILVVVGVIGALWIIGALLPDHSTTGSATGSGSVTVEYRVTGTARSADLTYTGSGGQTTQQNGTDVPLRLKSSGADHITVIAGHGDFMQLSVQNQGESGTIACSITADGVLVTSNQSSGGFAIADCQATLP